MITQETAARIWEIYREISVAEKILADMYELRKKEGLDEYEPSLRNVFGKRAKLQLGIPCGENSHRLFDVSPKLAESVIMAHIHNKKAELAEANEQARIEMDQGE